MQGLPERQGSADVVGICDDLTAHASLPPFGSVAVPETWQVNETRKTEIVYSPDAALVNQNGPRSLKGERRITPGFFSDLRPFSGAWR